MNLRTLPALRLLALLLALCLLCGCAVTELKPPEIPDPVPMDEPAAEPEPEPQPEPEPAADPEPEPAADPEPEPAADPDPEPATDPDPEPEKPDYPEFPEGITLASGQAFVYDLDEGGIVAMKGRGEQLYPASTTKLLTILTALQYLPTDALVQPGSEQSLVAPDASIAYVNSSHILTVEQLIEGMLLPSGNDAACALAAAAGRASVGDEHLDGVAAVGVFVDAMNDYAAELGMSESHFVTVDGYLDENHYSTVEDMARLAVAAAENETIRKYCGLASDDVVYASGHTIHWTNTNLMLDPESEWYSPYVTGIKTGALSGHFCLIASMEKDGKHYVAGVFTGQNNEDRFGDMTTIVNWLFGGDTQ